MKRTIFTLVILTYCIGVAWGQGSVVWSSAGGLVSWQTNSTTYSPFFGGGVTGSGTIGFAAINSAVPGPTFRYELLYGALYNGSVNVAPTTLSDLNTWSDSSLSATNAIVGGRIVCAPSSTGAATPVGWNYGSTNYIMLVGWSANLGSTWSAAKATLNSQSALAMVNGQAFFGVSKVGYVMPAIAGQNPGAVLFGAGGGLIQSTNTPLYLVPSSYAFPPAIQVPPTGQTVAAGSSASLSVSAFSTVPMTYQWFNGSGPVLDATNSTLTFNPALTNYTGSYGVVVSNASGSVTSSAAALMVYQPVSIVAAPADQLVSYGDTASFSVVAAGFPTVGYQWSFKGANIAGANSSTLAIPGVTTNQLGAYSVLATNAYSSAPGGSAVLTMLPSLVAPFAGISGLWGQPGTLVVVAAGSGTLAYQWYKDGVAIAGANGANYSISSLQFTNGGSYSVVVSSAYGSVTNVAAPLQVRPSDVIFGVYAGITVQGTVGNSYSIQYSTDLVNWITTTNVTLDQPSLNWTDYSVDFRSNPGRYYRVIPTP
jgi:hypothetical protein